MQVTFGRLAAILLTLTIVTTAAGLYVLQVNFRSLEARHDVEARDRLRAAAAAMRNQIRFYQRMLALIGSNPEAATLLEFGDDAEIVAWSQKIAGLLPGALGTALVSPRHVLFGDALALRVGPRCRADLQDLAGGDPIEYPLLHTDVAGLEHFDVLSPVQVPSGELAGKLFVSFRLAVLEELLAGLALPGDRFVLLGSDGDAKLSVGAVVADRALSVYRTQVANTPWELILQRPAVAERGLVADLAGMAGAVLLVVALVTLAVVRSLHDRFRSDLARVHRALDNLLQWRYDARDPATAFPETAALMPAIDRLARRFRQQDRELRQRSLSDPLTGVYNRRFFDLMLGHQHEQSRRQPPAVLVVVDLNDFAQLNADCGHATGDRVLHQVATYLCGRVRATDVVARIAGDRFGLLLTNMDQARLTDWVAALVHDHDHRALETLREKRCACQFSVGAAFVDARAYPRPADVLAAANSAMYEVKSRRRIRHSRFAIARAGSVLPVTVQALP